MMNQLFRPMYLPDLLIAALERNGDRPTVFLGDEVLSANRVSNEVSRYIQVLRSRKIEQGSGIATLSKNRVEVLFSMGAVMAGGYRNTPLHPLGSIDDHAYVLTDGGIDTLIFDPSFAEHVALLAAQVPTLTRLFSYGPASIGDDLMSLASEFTAQKLIPPTIDGESVSALAYTGGTTGRPKGVMNTYRASAAMAQIMTTEWQWPAEVRHLICTPLSHAGSSLFVPILLNRGSMFVLPGFDAGAVLAAIERHRITSVMLVPSMIYALLDHPNFSSTDLSSLETVFYGASAMSPTRLQEAIRKLGPIFFQFFGQTECPMVITGLRKEDHIVDDLRRLASCGRPVPWAHVALLDEHGNEVPPGQPGELCVRGPLVMLGYLNRPEETESAFAGGWLHTGDIARADVDGFLTIVDRTKDMIISGGFNVFPREIEDVLSQHPAVAAVAVIGVPDDKWGEAVKAIVVARAGQSVDVDELIALVKQHKGSHYAPKSIDIVDAIPLSAVGKPDKKVLRARYWGDTGRLVN